MRTEDEIRREIIRVENEINVCTAQLIKNPDDDDERKWRQIARQDRRTLLWVLSDAPAVKE